MASTKQINSSLLISQYIALALSAFFGFIIPFVPVYILITDNGSLELGAILVFYAMLVNIPIGFVVGIILYRGLTRNSVRIISTVLQVIIFLGISLTPSGIFKIFSNQQIARYESEVSDFQVTADVRNEKISSQKSPSGQMHLYYECDVLLTNSAGHDFSSVSVIPHLVNNEDKYLSTSHSETVILPAGGKSVHTRIDLSNGSTDDAQFTENMTIKITVTNDATNISKDFTFPSKLINWGQVNKNIIKFKADNKIPTGYQRFTNYTKGIQMDFPTNWTGYYGAESGAPPASAEDATNHGFGKYDVGVISIQWDNSLPTNLCNEGITESNVEDLMSGNTNFLQTFNTLKSQGIKVRVCVNDKSKTNEIKNTLLTLKIIDSK